MDLHPLPTLRQQTKGFDWHKTPLEAEPCRNFFEMFLDLIADNYCFGMISNHFVPTVQFYLDAFRLFITASSWIKSKALLNFI